MSVLHRLEKSLAFLKANEWGQDADKADRDGKPCYCARGAVIYGGFPEKADQWCVFQAHWHNGPCEPDEDGECWESAAEPEHMPEYRATIKSLDEAVRAVEGDHYRWSSIVDFNDRWRRTKDEVVSVFEKAIEIEKEK